MCIFVLANFILAILAIILSIILLTIILATEVDDWLAVGWNCPFQRVIYYYYSVKI